MLLKIAEDTREIVQIHATGDHQTSNYTVGQDGVTKIIPYSEYGEFSMLTFMAIYKGEEIAARLGAGNLHIYYKLQSTDA